MLTKAVGSSAKYLLLAGVLFFVALYLAEFTTRQSIFAAVVLSAILYSLRNLQHKPMTRFSPYFVLITPFWSRLLTDYHLVAGVEEWRAIEQSLNKKPLSERSVLRFGVYFTVVQQSDDFERTLLYSNYDRSFSSEVDYELDMAPIKIKREGEDPFLLGDHEVYFLAKWGVDGYNLGLVVPESWWSNLRHSCPKPLAEERRHPTGQVELILATIPYREFDVYWDLTSYDQQYAQNVAERRDDYRSKFSWKIREENPPPELALHLPDTLCHKYFEVQHRAI